MGPKNLFDRVMNSGFDDIAKLGINPKLLKVVCFRNIHSLLGEMVGVVLASELKLDVGGLRVIVASI